MHFQVSACLIMVGVVAVVAPSVGRGDQPATEHPATVAVPRCYARKVSAPERAVAKSDIPPDLPARTRELLENTFSESAETRAQAATSIGEQYGRSVPAIPFLMRLLDDNTIVGIERTPGDTTLARSKTVSVAASDAIVAIGKPSVDSCLSALKLQSGTVRGDKLMQILGRIKDPRAVESLTSLVGDRDPCVREAAIESLDGWTDARFVAPIISALRDNDSEVRVSAARACFWLHDYRLVLPLVTALRDTSDEVRWSSANALGWQRDQRAVPALLGAMRDPAEGIPTISFSGRALGMIADRPSLDGLLGVLNDKSLPPITRGSAATGLAISKGNQFLEPLTALAKDRREDSGLRRTAVFAVADLGGPRAIRFLTRIASDAEEDQLVRCSAAVQLVKLTGGAIEDAGILEGLGGQFEEPEEGGRSRVDAVLAVAKHGKTLAVRKAAETLLDKRWPSEVRDATDKPTDPK